MNSPKKGLENIFANVKVIFYFVNRLFSPTLSHQSLAQSLEFESAAMLSSSFLDARFEMEHAVKTESRRVSVCWVIPPLPPQPPTPHPESSSLAQP